MLDIGSILTTEPDKEYIKNCFYISEWRCTDEEEFNQRIYLISKTFLDVIDTAMLWLDVYRPAVPKEIYEDAKRILFDLEPDKLFWHTKHINPSNTALTVIFISSHLHGFDFKSAYNHLLKLKGEGREQFGLKRKSFRSGNHSPKIYNMITNYAQCILDTMPEKIDNLKKMRKKLEEIT